MEIPPRVRRRVIAEPDLYRLIGNTSACAEKSAIRSHSGRGNRKYLRVCGEESQGPQQSVDHREIPPRVRRRGNRGEPHEPVHGNTSACAEKSSFSIFSAHSRRKYLRVCGEERCRCPYCPLTMEIPPRVRRREFPTCGFTKKFLQVREFRQIRSQAATDHRSPESLGDYSPSYLRRTPALGWDHY